MMILAFPRSPEDSEQAEIRPMATSRRSGRVHQWVGYLGSARPVQRGEGKSRLLNKGHFCKITKSVALSLGSRRQDLLVEIINSCVMPWFLEKCV